MARGFCFGGEDAGKESGLARRKADTQVLQ